MNTQPQIPSKGAFDFREAIYALFTTDNQGNLIAGGTGFVISTLNILITARHVIAYLLEVAEKGKLIDAHFEDKYIQGASFARSIKNKETNGAILINIHRTIFVGNSDIAVCQFKYAISDGLDPEEFKALPALPLDLFPPSIGQRIQCFGYPDIRGELIDQSMMAEINVESQQGLVEDVFVTQRDQYLLNFPSFQTNAWIKPGMSGGPIVNMDTGFICGVCISGVDLEFDHKIGYGALLYEMVNTQLPFASKQDPTTKPFPLSRLMQIGYIHSTFNRNDFRVKIEDQYKSMAVPQNQPIHSTEAGNRPIPIGGDMGLKSRIIELIDCKDHIINEKIEAPIQVRFIVESDGKVNKESFRVEVSVDAEVDKSFTHLILKERFNPAIQNNTKCQFEYTMRVDVSYKWYL